MAALVTRRNHLQAVLLLLLLTVMVTMLSTVPGLAVTKKVSCVVYGQTMCCLAVRLCQDSEHPLTTA